MPNRCREVSNRPFSVCSVTRRKRLSQLTTFLIASLSVWWNPKCLKGINSPTQNIAKQDTITVWKIHCMFSIKSARSWSKVYKLKDNATDAVRPNTVTKEKLRFCCKGLYMSNKCVSYYCYAIGYSSSTNGHSFLFWRIGTLRNHDGDAKEDFD